MELERFVAKGATVIPILREAGLSDTVIKKGRTFSSEWAWQDGALTVVTVWIDEADERVTPVVATTVDPVGRDDLKGARRRRALERYAMLQKQHGKSVRALLQSKQKDAAKREKGLAEARGLDPEVWYVQATRGAVRLQRGQPFGPMPTHEEDIDLSAFTLGASYSRIDIAELGGVTPPVSIFATKWSQGILEFANAALLFVTLEKENYTYEDYFRGPLFYWQSQNRQTRKTPLIRRILGEELPCYLFARVRASTGNKTEPFVYCGALSHPAASGDNPVTCVFRSLDYVEGASGALGAIYAWAPDTAMGTEAEARLNDLKSKATKAGQGRQPDTELRTAIEWYAMEKAEQHYKLQGWTVRDTSAKHPYDFECTRGSERRRVEVKGTTSVGESVLVTAGEVIAALDPTIETDLFVVRNIRVARTDGDRHLSEGDTTVVSPWRPRPDELKPTEYRCQVSRSSDD